MDFAVNEQCAQLIECTVYDSFLASGKPVFHIEYPTPLNVDQTNGVSCIGPGTSGMSTVLKDLTLNGVIIYCDKSQVDTPTKGGTAPLKPSIPPRPSTSRPPIPSTTSRPILSTTLQPSSSRTSSSQRPTSSPPGGCVSKHWDQCGGQDWKGCTVCEVRSSAFSFQVSRLMTVSQAPYRCQGVSPPWYYQCL